MNHDDIFFIKNLSDYGRTIRPNWGGVFLKNKRAKILRRRILDYFR